MKSNKAVSPYVRSPQPEGVDGIPEWFTNATKEHLHGSLRRRQSYPLRDFEVALGRALRGARIFRKLTQRELASAVLSRLGRDSGRSSGQSYIAKLEGGWLPSLDRLAILASVVRLPPSALIVATDAVLFCQALRQRSERAVAYLCDEIYPHFERVVKGAENGSETIKSPQFRTAVAAWAQEDSEVPSRFPGAVGSALKILRHNQRRTQHDIAAALNQQGAGTSAAIVCQFETGHTGLSLERTIAVCGILNVNLDQAIARAELSALEDRRPIKDQIVDLTDQFNDLAGQFTKLSGKSKAKDTTLQRLVDLQKAISNLAKRYSTGHNPVLELPFIRPKT